MTKSFSMYLTYNWFFSISSGSRGGAEGAMAPPSPVEISHKKYGCQKWPHRFHVSWPPPPPTQLLDPMLSVVIMMAD